MNTSAQQARVAAIDRVLTRYRSARERCIRLADTIARADGLITGVVSPFEHLAKALRPGADLWLPQQLVSRREEIRAFMVSELPPAPDERTASAVDRLVGAVATGLAFVGGADTQGDLAIALAHLITSQLIPFPEAA